MMDSIPIPLPGHLPSHADVVLDQRDDHDDHDDDDENDEEQPADCPATALAPSGTENGSVELWSKQSRPRGRRARDPDAEVVRFDCKDIDDLETNLRDYLEAPTADAEHATIEFHFPVTAAFMVYTRDFKRDSTTNWTSADVTDLMRKTAVSVYEVLQETQNPKDQIVRQKAVGRTIVEAVQRADKFRYSFHNNWLSREDQAHRFSFFCNDSTLNKGRAANGGAGTEGKARRKPVYDCKGLIAVKFSVTKQNLEVHYKHVPIHKTFDERAPLPRRESKRRRMMEVLDPAGLKVLREERKKKRREERLAAGWVPSKGGRRQKPEPEVTASPLQRRRRYSEGPQTTNINEQAIADEGLQPLLDFLGSAERTGGSEDDNDDGIVMTDRDGRPLQDRESDAQSTTPPAFPREKSGEVRKTVPRRRAKYHGPLLPGMMEGTLQSGNMSWSVTTPTKPAEAQPSQGSSTKPTTHKQKQKRKQREETEEDRDGELKRQNREQETELEQLKRRLYETEQRLMKIETEKGMAANSTVPPPPPPPQPPAYPQYPQHPYYPYYPYPPPPHPHYHLPPQSQPPSSPAPTPVDGPQQPAWRQYQPCHKSAAALPQSQQPADGTPPSISQQASSQQVPAQNPTGQMPIDQTVVRHPATDSEPTQSARVDCIHEFAATGDAGEERLRGETGSQRTTLAGQPTTENRTIPAPVTSQSSTGTSAPTTKSVAQSQLPISSENQAPPQGPSQIESALSGKSRPAPPSWVQYLPRSSDAQATRRSLGPAPQQPTQSSSSNKTSSKRSPPQPVRGGVKLNDSRHIAPAARSDDREDPHLKGLFDSAMAAIMRPDGVAVTNNDKMSSTATTVSIEFTPASTTCGSTPRIVNELYTNLSPTGASSFRLPNHKTPPRNYYKYGDSSHAKSRDSGGKTSTKPPGTNGTSVAPPSPPPYYPYPYPPQQQSYPPYPPLPGYGYPPYLAYQYPPALAPHPTETEEQRKLREQKEKDDREGAPGWATQLREAMRGYANSTPVPTSTGKKKPAEARDESVAVSNEGQMASDPANRSNKDTGQASERQVLQIASNVEDDDEAAEQSRDGGRREE